MSKTKELMEIIYQKNVRQIYIDYENCVYNVFRILNFDLSLILTKEGFLFPYKEVNSLNKKES